MQIDDANALEPLQSHPNVIQCNSSSQGCGHQLGVTRAWPSPTTSPIYSPTPRANHYPLQTAVAGSSETFGGAPEFTPEGSND